MDEREQELKRMMDLYADRLTALCCTLVKDRCLAQDIVQETFIRAWRKMDELRGGKQSEKAWLCRIAINRCRDYQRTRWLRMVDMRAEPLEAWCSPMDDASADVMEALGKLKPRYREVLTLHYLENMSAEEIGQSISLSASAVYRRLKKAKDQLKKLLEGGENDG